MLRQLAVDDIGFFIEKVLEISLQPFHRKWLRYQIENQKSLLLAPRGHGKSTISTIGYCLWQLVKNPNIRILIVSSTSNKAQGFLREIKQHFESNQKFKEVFPEFTQGSKWSDLEICLANKTSISKEPNVLAVGASGQVVSKHVDLIIADDLIDQENARTDHQREMVYEWYTRSLLPTLEPNGKIHILGTRYHSHDLYGELINTSYQNCHLISKAIDENDLALWPSRFSLEKLQEVKKEIGAVAFQLQYQNNVSLSKGSIFRPEWIKYYSELPKIESVYQGVDLAISQRQTADFFSIVTIGIDDYKRVYVLDVYQERLTFKNQKEIIRQKFLQFSPVCVAIEAIAYQKSIVQELRFDYPDMRINEINTNKDKVTRAQKLSIYFENGNVFMRRDMTLLEEQLLQFPYLPHDDLFDALEFAVVEGLNRHTKLPMLPSLGISIKNSSESSLRSFEQEILGGSIPVFHY